MENLAAPAGGQRRRSFPSAASPGVISLFFRNDYYNSHEDYLFAIAEAMRHEYETVANAGVGCNSTVPISPWAAMCNMPISASTNSASACGCISRR